MLCLLSDIEDDHAHRFPDRIQPGHGRRDLGLVQGGVKPAARSATMSRACRRAAHLLQHSSLQVFGRQARQLAIEPSR